MHNLANNKTSLPNDKIFKAKHKHAVQVLELLNFCRNIYLFGTYLKLITQLHFVPGASTVFFPKIF